MSVDQDFINHSLTRTIIDQYGPYMELRTIGMTKGENSNTVRGKMHFGKLQLIINLITKVIRFPLTYQKIDN